MRLLVAVVYALGLVPLVWLVAIRSGGQRLPAAWWWLAAAYAVSFVADTAAHWVDPWAVSAVYPITQAAFAGGVLLRRRQLYGFLAVLVGVAIIGTALASTIPLRVVAWGTVAGLAWQRPDLGRLRWALVVTFGGGALAWGWTATAPGWPSWGTLQGVRALGTLLFCWAALRPLPFVTYLEPGQV